MTATVIDLTAHQASLCQRADELKGWAIRLKLALRNEVNLPLPERETDNLIRALAEFTAAAEGYPR